MKFLKHILLFCCCLLVLPLLSTAKSHATNSWVLDYTDIVDIPFGCATWASTSFNGISVCPGNVPPTGTCSVSQDCKIRTSCPGAYYEVAIYTCVASGPGPVNGTCGTANTGRFYTAPTTYLCGLGDGVATPAPTGTGPHPHSWTWTCGGSGGGSASPPCTATQKYDGVCGSSHYQFLTSEPTTNLCAPGFPASVVAGGSAGPWTWTCEGLNTGLTTNCTSRIALNGSCGSADGVARSTAPSANLCGAGTPSSVTGTGPWNWTCDGTGVGTKSASCSAPLPPPPPSFGGACPS